jgi:hypothetical protein
LAHLKASIDAPTDAYLIECGHAIPLDTHELRLLLYLAVAFLHKEHQSQLVSPFNTSPSMCPFVESGFPACMIGFSPRLEISPDLESQEEAAKVGLSLFGNLNNEEPAPTPNKRTRSDGAADGAQPNARTANQPSLPPRVSPEHHAPFDGDAEEDRDADIMEEDDGGGAWSQRTHQHGSVSFSQSQPPPSRNKLKAGLAKPPAKTQEGFSDELQALVARANLSSHPSYFVSTTSCHGKAVVYLMEPSDDYSDGKKVLVVLADIGPLFSLAQVLIKAQFDYPNATFHWQSASGDKAQQRLAVRLYGLPEGLSPMRLSMWWRSMFGDNSFIQARQFAQGTDEGKAAPCWEVHGAAPAKFSSTRMFPNRPSPFRRSTAAFAFIRSTPSPGKLPALGAASRCALKVSLRVKIHLSLRTIQLLSSKTPSRHWVLTLTGTFSRHSSRRLTTAAVQWR